MSLPFEALAPGMTLRTATRTITAEDLLAFAKLTGDCNPAHTNPSAARNGPFGEQIAHGMLVLSYAVGLLPLDPALAVALRDVHDVTFKRPATIGTTISVDATTEDVRPLTHDLGLVHTGLAVRDAGERLLVRGRLGLLWRRAAAQDACVP